MILLRVAFATLECGTIVECIGGSCTRLAESVACHELMPLVLGEFIYILRHATCATLFFAAVAHQGRHLRD